LEIPPNLDEETVITVSAVLCGLVEGHIDNYGRNSLRRQVIYVSNDGFRNIDAMGNDQLWYSFEALHVDLNTPE
jgi:hypothetical protein